MADEEMTEPVVSDLPVLTTTTLADLMANPGVVDAALARIVPGDGRVLLVAASFNSAI